MPLMQSNQNTQNAIPMACLILSVRRSLRFLLCKSSVPLCASVSLWFVSLPLLLTGCATPYIDPGASSLVSGARLTGQTVPAIAAGRFEHKENECTPQDCPFISDNAVIEGRMLAADSGAPFTQHPGLDLHVHDGPASYILRIHFGDLGDGTNTCLPFYECPGISPLPETYRVSTARLKNLLAYLKDRNFCVGKFTSWGVPVWPIPAKGSNCGDAFVQALARLGIAPEALLDMQFWIMKNKTAIWAFQRGNRKPVDEFFNGAPTSDRFQFQAANQNHRVAASP